MLNFVCGKVVDITFNSVVVENNGIGFDIGVSQNTISDCALGEIVKIFTYMHVREDALALYGFSRLEEKKLFLRLIEISGIGPKMAMQILGGYDLRTLTVAIATGDTKTLCKIKGLGKKTAELLVLHLKEQVSNDLTQTETVEGGSSMLSDDVSDAVFALCSLGISKTDAIKEVTELAKTVSGVENLIASALKKLA